MEQYPRDGSIHYGTSDDECTRRLWACAWIEGLLRLGKRSWGAHVCWFNFALLTLAENPSTMGDVPGPSEVSEPLLPEESNPGYHSDPPVASMTRDADEIALVRDASLLSSQEVVKQVNAWTTRTISICARMLAGLRDVVLVGNSLYVAVVVLKRG